jgi:hypothetical protein
MRELGARAGADDAIRVLKHREARTQQQADR